MKKVMLLVLLTLAMTSVMSAQTSAPVPVVIKPADIPKPSKRDLGVHILVACSFQVVGDGVSNQITVKLANWSSYCGQHPTPFTNPDTSDLAVVNVYFPTPTGSIGPLTVPISYDDAGNFTFTFPVTPPAGSAFTLSFNVYYSH